MEKKKLPLWIRQLKRFVKEKNEALEEEREKKIEAHLSRNNNILSLSKKKQPK